MASKYEKGEQFIDVIMLIDYMLDGGMVYWRNKVYSPGWLLNWSVARLKQSVSYGIMYKAVLKTQEKEKIKKITIKEGWIRYEIRKLYSWRA